MKCIVKSCQNTPKKLRRGISYHHLPKYGELKTQWLKSIGLGEQDVKSRNSIVCSAHFENHYFMPQTKENQKRFLRKSAIPTLFLEESTCVVGADEYNLENTCSNINQTVIPYHTEENMFGCSEQLGQIGANFEVPFHVEEDRNYALKLLGDVATKSLHLIRINTDHDYTPIDEVPELMVSGSNIDLCDVDLFNREEMENLNKENISNLNKNSPKLQTVPKIANSSPLGSATSPRNGTRSSSVSKIIKSSYKHKKFNKITIKRAIASCDDLSTSPRKKLRRPNLQILRNNKMDKKNSNLRKKNSRQRKQITLGHLLDELEDNNLISSCQKDKFLDHCNPNSIILNRCRDNISYRKLGRKYSEEIRKFALNLNFYSPKAYEYIRKQFKNYSPNSRTLDNWYKVVNGHPGFTTESFRTLELLVRSKRKSKEVVIGNVCLGEMYIHPKYEYDLHTKKVWGCVEFEGSDPNDHTLATQVIVFMFVSCTARWKIPLGYFPVSSLTSLQKKNMIESCLRLLYDVGVITIGVTFDGLSENFTLTRELGCNVHYPNINLAFKLVDISQQFLIFFDPYHMFKLVRNVLANKGPLVDSDGNKISWHYLEELHKIQSEEGSHLANKLRKVHIYFNNQKMKVNLAVQTLSNSVASALEFCDSVLKLPQFEGCSGTINFIRVFNNSLDILNSKQFEDYDLKTSITKSNFNLVLNNVKSSIEYISGLKFLSDGIKVIDSKSKTGFIGIICCLSNIQVLHDTYLKTRRLKYISFYKLSQVHIELFFSIIRSRLERNSNPTLNQFITSYKRILTSVQLNDASFGNCIPQTEVSILNVSNFNSDSLINSSINQLAMLEASSDDIPIGREILEGDEPNMYDEGFLGYPITLSEFSINVIEHIGELIVRYLFRKLNCEDCCKLIQQCNSYTSLTNLKNKGGLLTPSPSVLKICKYSEAVLKRELAIADYKNITQLQSNSKLFKKISYNVLYNLISVNIFNDEDQCSHSQEHVNLLAHSIIEKYYDIRLNYFCKQWSYKLTNSLFSGQRYNNNSIGTIAW